MMPLTSNEKQQERNWLDLPSDVTANILKKIGMFDILENAQKVCTAWYKICKDPAMWRVINMNDIPTSSGANRSLVRICEDAVDRSQGQLVDITIVYVYHSDLIQYVADRSSQLRRLEIVYGLIFVNLTTNALMKFPLLEELNLYWIDLSKEEIEAIGQYCTMLKTLKVNSKRALSFRAIDTTNEVSYDDETAIAIGQNLLALRHLELIGNRMTNTGLRVILDNCCHLETLDLRECFYIDLKGDLGEQCIKQIKYVKLPNDPLEVFPNVYGYHIG